MDQNHSIFSKLIIFFLSPSSHAEPELRRVADSEPRRLRAPAGHGPDPGRGDELHGAPGAPSPRGQLQPEGEHAPLVLRRHRRQQVHPRLRVLG